MHLTLALTLAVPIIVATCWLYTANVIHGTFPRLHGKRICLLIAHPDDEAMFFAPSVLALTAPELGNHVKILCLSSGMIPPYQSIHGASETFLHTLHLWR